jgi:hypothetical protein
LQSRFADSIDQDVISVKEAISFQLLDNLWMDGGLASGAMASSSIPVNSGWVKVLKGVGEYPRRSAGPKNVALI